MSAPHMHTDDQKGGLSMIMGKFTSEQVLTQCMAHPLLSEAQVKEVVRIIAAHGELIDALALAIAELKRLHVTSTRRTIGDHPTTLQLERVLTRAKELPHD